ncbi:hypothetical protein A9239_06755 [Methanosarcina sp. A14]|nr:MULTISPECIES: hypothetical protein [Methanosarcina]AKB58389.1 hypothetical protein MSBR2_1873 [Methanosarcina barkeri 227]OED11748.1 hypothetical protein A9239_06755 [Methanosarcina sp. A14]
MGFCIVEKVSSPKLQFHAIGEPEVLFLKVTLSGAFPILGDPWKLTTGFDAVVPTVKLSFVARSALCHFVTFI